VFSGTFCVARVIGAIGFVMSYHSTAIAGSTSTSTLPWHWKNFVETMMKFGWYTGNTDNYAFCMFTYPPKGSSVLIVILLKPLIPM
jgi:hypothetical protein